MANGDISAPVDTLEFVLTDITFPDMIHVSGDIYAIAYSDADGDGMVVTIDIAEDGQIGAGVVDSLEFDTVDGYHPSIVHVTGDIYAIAYKGVDADGWICTVEITAAGAIGAAVEDTLEFEDGSCYEPEMIRLASDMVAIVHRGAANQGVLTTVSIAANGQIAATVEDMKEAWATNVNHPQICNVDGDIFAIVYRDNLSDGHVCTVQITAAGAIGAAVEDTLEFDTAMGEEPTICHALGNIFVIAYRGPGDTGWVCTVEITAAGAIGAAVEDTLEFDAVNCTYPDIIHIGSGICAIAYGGDASDGWVCTVQTDAVGAIDDPIIDSEEYDDYNGTHPSIVHVAGNTYAVGYVGDLSDGFIKTPIIVTPADGPKHLMMMGIG